MTLARYFTTALAALAVSVPAHAQDGMGASRILDSQEVEAYVDGVVSAYQKSEGIAGVTVAVVRGDQVLLQKGYGIAALEPRRIVDPQTTLFRIASISKTFTYVMTMQLVSEGKLKLDAPVDDYLPDSLKFAGDGFAVPKVIDLLQHSAGFEDSALGHLFTPKPSESLENYLIHFRPKRVRAPGTEAVYSNYSVALLGYILARIDGRPYEDMVEKRILYPLHIDSLVTFREPADNPGKGILSSIGFKRTGGWFAPQPVFSVAQIAPAGSASATAAGMSRYMRMLLRGGALDGEVILSADAYQAMLKPTFQNAPEAASMAHGFFRRTYGRYQSMEHDGAALFFFSSMVLLPDADFGIFVAVNTDSGDALTAAMPRLVIEHFFSEARPGEPVRADGVKLPEDAAGPYLIERRNFSSFEAFLYRLADNTMLMPRDDGSYVLSSGNQRARYVVESDGVLRALESGGRVRLQTADGAIAGFAGPSAVGVGRKLGLLDTPLTFVIAAGLLVLGSFICLVTLFARIYYRAGAGQSSGERIASGWQAITATAWLAALGFFAFSALPLLEPDVAVLNYPGPLIPLARLGLYGAAGATAILVLMLWPAWSGRRWRARRLTFTFYALTALAFALLLWRWGALGTPLSIAG